MIIDMAKRYMHVFENNSEFQSAHNGTWDRYWVSVEMDTMRVAYDRKPADVTLATGKKVEDK